MKDGYISAMDLVGTLMNFPTPKNLTNLKSFLGIIGQFAQAAPELAKKEGQQVPVAEKPQCYNGEHQEVLCVPT